MKESFWLMGSEQGFVKGEVFCFRYPYFYFQNEESTSSASQQTSTASHLSKDLKVPLLLQNLGNESIINLLILRVFKLWTNQ